MGKSILDLLVQNNEFPVLFIGSGISKRYLNNYPNWEELLENIWKDVDPEFDFYAYLNRLKNEIHIRDNNNVYFEVNTRAATALEKKINHMFYNNELKISGLAQETAYKGAISPFKKLLSNKFAQYRVKSGIDEELDLYKKLLLKSQVIFTTNYDDFIENCYNGISKYSIKKYIGRPKWFF